MPVTLEQVERDALSLAPPEREALIDRLVDSLDEAAGEDTAETDALIAECERRWAGIVDGSRVTIPAEEILAELERIVEDAG